MTTRIISLSTLLAANAAPTEIGEGISPSSGLNWTLVEVRPFFQGKGDFYLFVDDQQYLQVASEDVATYGKPHVVGIQIAQPVVFHIKFDDRSGSSNYVGVDLVIEETTQGGGGAPAGGA